MDISSFLSNFASNLAADLVAGLFLSYFIVRIIDANKRVKAVINAYYFEKDGILQLSLSNYSNYYLKSGEVFYTLYIAEDLLLSMNKEQPTNYNLTMSQRDIEIKDKKYAQFSGTTDTNCFAGIKIGLSRIKMKAPSNGDLLFYVSTVYGPFPKQAAQREPGLLHLNKLGVVKVEVR